MNLAIIGRLDLLHEQLGNISIPPAVVDELRTGEGLPGSGKIRKAVQEGWLEVSQTKDPLLA